MDEPVGEAFLRCVEEARQRLATEVDQAARGSPSTDARLRPSVRMARVYAETGMTVPGWLGVLAIAEECVAAWDDPEGLPDNAADPVRACDGWRCMGPECVHRRIERNHIHHRSQGGSDDPSNLVCLCAGCHRMGEHGGLARVRGTAPLGLIWRSGRPGLEIWWRNETKLFDRFGRERQPL